MSLMAKRRIVRNMIKLWILQTKNTDALFTLCPGLCDLLAEASGYSWPPARTEIYQTLCRYRPKTSRGGYWWIPLGTVESRQPRIKVLKALAKKYRVSARGL